MAMARLLVSALENVGCVVAEPQHLMRNDTWRGLCHLSCPNCVWSTAKRAVLNNAAAVFRVHWEGR